MATSKFSKNKNLSPEDISNVKKTIYRANYEEFALVDLISQPNTISFNEDYSQELTQAQKDYTIGLILCTAEYYYTLYTKNESGKGIFIDVKPENHYHKSAVPKRPIKKEEYDTVHKRIQRTGNLIV